MRNLSSSSRLFSDSLACRHLTTCRGGAGTLSSILRSSVNVKDFLIRRNGEDAGGGKAYRNGLYGVRNCYLDEIFYNVLACSAAPKAPMMEGVGGTCIVTPSSSSKSRTRVALLATPPLKTRWSP